MHFCTCPEPIRGPSTVTDYGMLPVEYALCFTCGLPIALSGRPPVDVNPDYTVREA